MYHKYMDYRLLNFETKNRLVKEVWETFSLLYTNRGGGESMAFWKKQIQKTIEDAPYFEINKYPNYSLRSIFDIMYLDNNWFSRMYYVKGSKKVYLYEIEN